MSKREKKVRVLHRNGDGAEERDDRIAVEEPLEIRIGARTLGVTMRTPGNDEELAAGLLLAEGIVRSIDEIGSIIICQDETTDALKNVVNVRLVEGITVDWDRLARLLLTNSSCGLCGKAHLDALKTRAEPLSLNSAIAERGAANPNTTASHSTSPHPNSDPNVASATVTLPFDGSSAKATTVDPTILARLPGTLRSRQIVFEMTGGLHAAGLFDFAGSLLVLREDVGRHNAVDKVIGAASIQGLLPATDRILLVSGRASYEIVQKAIVARIPIVAAVSAPSSLAVDLAHEFGVTLVGFLRGESFNIYTHAARIAV